MIDATTIHHIRRLVANGWRPGRIAHSLGLPAHAVKRALRGPVPR